MFSSIPQIKFELDKGRYELGDDLKVRVTIRGRKNLEIESAKLEFSCEESVLKRYRFFVHRRIKFYPFRDVKLLEKRMVITPSFERQYDHAFPIFPDNPPTYQMGMDLDLVSVSWKLTLSLERRDKPNVVQRLEIPVYSANVDLVDEPFVRLNSFEQADLEISIPKSHFKTGEMLEGKMMVKPKKNFKASAKVQLVRIEKVLGSGVPRGGLKQTRTEGESTAVSTNSSKSSLRDYRVGEVKDLLFKISISRNMRPTYRTKTSAAEWMVHGRLKDDLFITAPIIVLSC